MSDFLMEGQWSIIPENFKKDTIFYIKCNKCNRITEWVPTIPTGPLDLLRCPGCLEHVPEHVEARKDFLRRLMRLF